MGSSHGVSCSGNRQENSLEQTPHDPKDCQVQSFHLAPAWRGWKRQPAVGVTPLGCWDLRCGLEHLAPHDSSILGRVFYDSKKRGLFCLLQNFSFSKGWGHVAWSSMGNSCSLRYDTRTEYPGFFNGPAESRNEYLLTNVNVHDSEKALIT